MRPRELSSIPQDNPECPANRRRTLELFRGSLISAAFARFGRRPRGNRVPQPSLQGVGCFLHLRFVLQHGLADTATAFDMSEGAAFVAGAVTRFTGCHFEERGNPRAKPSSRSVARGRAWRFGDGQYSPCSASRWSRTWRSPAPPRRTRPPGKAWLRMHDGER